MKENEQSFVWLYVSIHIASYKKETINSINSIVSTYYVRITIATTTTVVVIVTIVVRYILFCKNNILNNS